VSKAKPVNIAAELSATETVDIDAILSEHVRKRAGTTCTVCAALAEMPADWRAKFEEAIDDVKRYSAMSLVNAFEKVDVVLARNSVERHRNRECLARRGHA
jgi:hypothetical protein